MNPKVNLYVQLYDFKGIKESVSEALSQIEPEEVERLMKLNQDEEINN